MFQRLMVLFKILLMEGKDIVRKYIEILRSFGFKANHALI